MENLKMANLGNRIVAYIIDAIGLSIIYFILAFVIGGAGAASMSASGDNSAAIGAMMGAMALVYLISIVLFLGYFTIMEASEKQGTFGKQIMKIKVVNQNGERLTMGESIMRNVLGRIINIFTCSIGYIIIFFTKDNQGLHDMVAKTYVVDATQSV
jgi:uncharacterized RDD family membrane protein YckC